MVTADRMRVVDDQMRDVPADGETIGEIVMRGNCVMKGYFNDEAATAKAFAGGWFHSGDLGVMQPDGYAKLVDRAKDIVISGGENISTVEVESTLMAHPAVVDVAVIGIPDDRWGEVPKAFVVLEAGALATEDELIEHVRSRIARYKAPKAVAFLEALPRTSTGKVQKYELREREWPARRSGSRAERPERSRGRATVVSRAARQRVTVFGALPREELVPGRVRWRELVSTPARLSVRRRGGRWRPMLRSVAGVRAARACRGALALALPVSAGRAAVGRSFGPLRGDATTDTLNLCPMHDASSSASRRPLRSLRPSPCRRPAPSAWRCSTFRARRATWICASRG